MATKMVPAWSNVYNVITRDTRKRNNHLDFGLQVIYLQVNKVLLRLTDLLYSLKMFGLVHTCRN